MHTNEILLRLGELTFNMDRRVGLEVEYQSCHVYDVSNLSLAAPRMHTLFFLSLESSVAHA